MRRFLLVLLLISGFTAVVEGILPCDVVRVSPQCYVALRPGPTRDALSLVDISGEQVSESAGELVLTTVSVERELTVGEMWRLRNDPTSRRADRSLYYPEDVDVEVTRQQFAAQMEESTQAAEVAALRHLGYALPATGVRVEALVEDGPSDGVLELGDVVVGFDGTTVTDFDSLLTALAEAAPGDVATLDVDRVDGTREQVEVTLAENPDDPSAAFLGLYLVTRVDVPVEIDIDAGQIGGPSAGLMFALSIVDLLSDEDLTGGMVVAGTGEIGLDGRVGPIGGIQQKIPGALHRDEGAPPAEVFLVPRGNVEEARGASVTQALLLVPVDTLGDAVDALAALREGRRPDGAFELTPTGVAAAP